MHTVDLLEQALATAERLGYKVRQEWLEGGGGGCEINGQKWIFLDLSLPAIEQLYQVAEAIGEDPGLSGLHMSPQLRGWLGAGRTA